SLRQGYRLTRKECGNRPQFWVGTDTTTVLGCHGEGTTREQVERTTTIAEWLFKVPASVWEKANDTRLVVACDRVHGGLHTGIDNKGAAGHVWINGELRDM